MSLMDKKLTQKINFRVRSCHNSNTERHKTVYSRNMKKKQSFQDRELGKVSCFDAKSKTKVRSKCLAKGQWEGTHFPPLIFVLDHECEHVIVGIES